MKPPGSPRGPPCADAGRRAGPKAAARRIAPAHPARPRPVLDPRRSRLAWPPAPRQAPAPESDSAAAVARRESSPPTAPKNRLDWLSREAMTMPRFRLFAGCAGTVAAAGCAEVKDLADAWDVPHPGPDTRLDVAADVDAGLPEDVAPDARPPDNAPTPTEVSEGGRDKGGARPTMPRRRRKGGTRMMRRPRTMRQPRTTRGGGRANRRERLRRGDRRRGRRDDLPGYVPPGRAMASATTGAGLDVEHLHLRCQLHRLRTRAPPAEHVDFFSRGFLC